MPGGRQANRAAFDEATRLSLLEGDMDGHDKALERIDSRLGKVLWSMIGVLISLTTTSVVLLLTVGVGR